MLISAISIDNLGVAVWFWISGGILYAVAREVINTKGDTQPPFKGGKQEKKKIEDTHSALAPIAALVCVVVALVFMVPAWRGSAEISRLGRNADGLNQQQYSDKIKKIATIEPNNVHSLSTLSAMAFNAQGIDLGFALANSVVSKDPKSYYGFQLLANAFEQTNKFNEAILQRKKMLALSPREQSNLVGIMKDYVLLKDKTNELAYEALIVKTFPTTGQSGISGMFESLANSNLAIDYRLRALNSNPNDVGSLVALINDYMKVGKMAEALALVPRVSALDPKGGSEAIAFEYTNQWAKALLFRKLAADENPNDAGTLLALAIDFAKLGQMDKANPLIARIQQLKPGSDEAKAAQALTKG